MQKNIIYKVTSRCGLDCHKCPAYIATVTNDDELKQKTVIEWNKRYNATGRLPITKEDIQCLGCLSLVEPIYKHCRECKARICGIKKGIQNCGECNDYYSCTIISSLHKQIPEAKILCEKAYKNISK